MEEKLQQSIRQTLAFFDVFDYPLTTPELWKFLWSYPSKISYFELLNELEKENQSLDGFNFLPGREKTVEIRQKTVKWQEAKMKIALRAAKKIKVVPFLRAVFVCNTLSGPGLSQNSDIDFFIVVKKGRLWLTRMLTTLILSVFGLRRTKKKIKDRICLSFYVTDDNLNLEKIALPDLSAEALAKVDVYLIYWLTQLIPVYDPDNLYNSVGRANQWIKKYVPNGFADCELTDRWQVKQIGFGIKVKKWFERVWVGKYGDLIESQAKEAQLVRMKRNYESIKDKPDTRVVINDKMLKFHEKDRRAEYRQEWLKRL